MLELAHIVWTVLLFVIFIAIVVWAWSKPQQQRFARAALLPLRDDSYGTEGNEGTPRATTQGNAPFPLTLDLLIPPNAPHTGGEGNESALRATFNKEQNHG